VPGLKLVILLVNEPVSLPLVVLLSAVVGLAEVLQHTPRAVTLSPPSEVTLPPPDAVVEVIEVIVAVVTVGVVKVVNVESPP
jgi:hypothetical protein